MTLKFKKKDRIYIIGPSGSGKSTLAKTLSKKLRISHYDLDDIFWIKKPIKKRKESLYEPKLKKLTQKKKWIIEGVFRSWVKEAIRKSNLIILIDLSSKILTWRLFIRYIKRKFSGKETGNLKETIKLVKYSRLYGKKKSNLYQHHQRLIKGTEKQIITIQNKKQLNEFLEDFLKK